MKKTYIILAVLVVATIVVAGCIGTANAKEEARYVVTDVESNEYITLRTIVDDETGVEYLWVEGGRKGGLTVMLDTDGKPKISKEWREVHPEKLFGGMFV